MSINYSIQLLRYSGFISILIRHVPHKWVFIQYNYKLQTIIWHSGRFSSQSAARLLGAFDLKWMRDDWTMMRI